jgi:tetratricopeptide (TPR) repeat protein
MKGESRQKRKHPLLRGERGAQSRVRVTIFATALPIFLLLAAGLIAYWNSFDAPFEFDDFSTIQSNSSVQFGDSFARIPSNLWFRTLLYMTFAANYAVGGQNVWGYHLVNFLLHLLTALLIFVLAKEIFSRARPPFPADISAFLASAFFLLHPIQTESVTYISSRSELLSTFFYLLGFLLFVRTRPEKIGFRFSLIIAAILALALGVKETTISLPAALLAYDFIFISNGEIRSVLSRWRFHLTFVAGGLAAAVYLVTFGNLRGSVGAAAAGIEPFSYFLTELRVIVRYIRIILVPTGLNLAYDFPISDNPLDLRVILSALLLLGLLGLAWWLRKRQPILSFSILWFFVTLAPTSSFFPINDVIFEHRLYLPMVGLCLSFPVLFGVLTFRSSHQRKADGEASRDPGTRTIGWSTGVVSSAILLALLTGTILRNEVWRDETRLWSDVISKSPDAGRGYIGLAWAYYKRADYQKALEITQAGLIKAKDSPNSRENRFRFYSNMGQIYFDLGRYAESAAALSQALHSATPPADRARTYYNLAAAYLAELNTAGPNDKAAIASLADDALNRSLASDGNFLPAWDSYIYLSVDRGMRELADQRLQQELQKNPATAFYGMGKLAFLERNYKSAVGYFGQAEKFFPDEKMVFFNYAYALEEVGNVDLALEKYITATRIDPLFKQAHYNLAQIYMKKQMDQPAIEHFEQVLRIDAKNTLAHLQLARIYIQHGQMGSARDHLNAVLTISPGNAEATALWRQARQN